MTIFAAWYFRLNFAVMFAASHIINNPWTMVPVYAADYYTGSWLTSSIGLDLTAWENPSWIDWANAHLTYYVGLPKLSLWVFLVGGNVLGICVSLLLYPFVFKIVSRMMHQNVLQKKIGSL